MVFIIIIVYVRAVVTIYYIEERETTREPQTVRPTYAVDHIGLFFAF